MALNNIFNEPRRELTEQAVGSAVAIVAVTAFAGADYWITNNWLREIDYFLGAFVVILGTLTLGLSLTIMHAIGEGICNRLQAHGIHLRPRTRPGR